jgi:hypothetical protein
MLNIRFGAFTRTSETFCMGHNVQWVIHIHNLEVLKTSTLKTSLRLVNISVLHIIGLSDTWKWLHIGYCKCISQTIQYKSTSDINRILILIVLYNGAILSWKRTSCFLRYLEVKYGRFFGLIKRMYSTSPDNSNTLLYQNIIQSSLVIMKADEMVP